LLILNNKQLGQILKMLKENMPALVEALAKDLGRHPMEAAGNFHVHL
jgi:hypothetical protein